MNSPDKAQFKFAVIQFKVPGVKNGGSDKGPDGNRIDSIPIANGIIRAGGACDMLLYDFQHHGDFEKIVEEYDVRLPLTSPQLLATNSFPTTSHLVPHAPRAPSRG